MLSLFSHGAGDMEMASWVAPYLAPLPSAIGLSLGPYYSSSPLTPTVPSSGPTNVSALATTSSSMLVRWSEIPEADRNGLVLGYKVDLGTSGGVLYHLPQVTSPRCPVLVFPSSGSLPHRGAWDICLESHLPVTTATRKSSLGVGRHPVSDRILQTAPLFQETEQGAPNLTLSPKGASQVSMTF